MSARIGLAVFCGVLVLGLLAILYIRLKDKLGLGSTNNNSYNKANGVPRYNNGNVTSATPFLGGSASAGNKSKEDISLRNLSHHHFNEKGFE